MPPTWETSSRFLAPGLRPSYCRLLGSESVDRSSLSLCPSNKKIQAIKAPPTLGFLSHWVPGGAGSGLPAAEALGKNSAASSDSPCSLPRIERTLAVEGALASHRDHVPLRDPSWNPELVLMVTSEDGKGPSGCHRSPGSWLRGHCFHTPPWII